MTLRLPQDVLVSGDAPPQVSVSGDVDELAARHRAALLGGDFASRAEALWGLVAHGEEAARWCREALADEDEDVVEDAAGVAAWIGPPPDLVPVLRERAGDVIALVVPPDDEEDPPAIDEMPFGPRHREMSEAWFVEAPYEKVCRFYRPWHEGNAWRTRFSEHHGTLDELLALLKPPEKPSTKSLLVETDSGWTAVFVQGGDGADWASHLGQALDTRALRTSYATHEKDAAGKVTQYGDVAFWLFEGDHERTIQASHQGSGWTWHLDGEPQPFEDLSRYEARRITQRFDRALLNDYCRALGIRREDRSYYGPRALLTEDEFRPS
jgi:hypothetical protein